MRAADIADQLTTVLVTEEEIRKHDERFHTVWMPHSLMDHRIVSPAEARRTVNEYMINVMHEEPVDPSLLDFDDSMGW